MDRDEYQRYLRSAHWQRVRKRFKASKLYKGGCYACGSTERLHIHHKTYKRLGAERLNDLLCLCEECHTKVHQVLRTRASRRTNLFNVAGKLKKVIQKRGKEWAIKEW